ncbi:hypothetical protein PsAD13_02246 [Pseudovibrio sp. Ad13]|uniref:hypothetical protein n=1 Tax=Pseudovibrio sp. Ad13 TaxID=989396 RepID=UPI0007B1ED29|nr:hypothetical protein [Pseudovibrio sp. Ad13]KZK84781.1 hypothetical protein PsAD13_02246 [Pseudovibrio sp. Ad13]
MRILIWTSPWILQGGTVFFAKNSYENHLLKQANTLARFGHDVYLLVPDAYKPLRTVINSKVKMIDVSVQDGIRKVGGGSTLLKVCMKVMMNSHRSCKIGLRVFYLRA